MEPTVRFEHELLAVESEHDVWCMLELAAPPAPANAERRPLSISLVIDRSGSMAGEKLHSARQAAVGVLEALHDGERFAAAAFDNEVKDMKVGEPAGIADNDLCLPAEPCPIALESRFAALSKENVVDNLRGFDALYRGADDGGLGFDDWLRAVGAGAFADGLGADVANAEAVVAAIPGTLEEAR